VASRCCQAINNTSAGTSRARNFSQNCIAWANVIERMPPTPTAVSTTANTTRPPSQFGAPVWVARVKDAPCSWGTR
jgi:hypothetical protein